MAETVKTDVLIVGAGLCGLMAAHALAEQGIQAMLLEKGSVVGGRLATLHMGPGMADEGAQFYTVRHPDFKQFSDAWLDSGLAYEWSRGWNDGSLALVRDGHPRYAIRGGFERLAQNLAQGHDVHLNVTLASLGLDGQRWVAQDVWRNRYEANAVIVTPPVPESLALLDEGSIPLDTPDRIALEAIHYAPSLTAMFWIEAEHGLPAPGGVQRPEANLRWIADNHRKGISPDAIIFTAQASPSYSRQLWSVPDEKVLSAIRVDMMPFLPDKAKIVQTVLKRWRYAQPETLHPERYLIAEGLPTLAFAGDAFLEARVEGASLSGLAVGRAVGEMVRT